MTTVIDIGPYIAKRKQHECSHPGYIVSSADDELVCSECSIDIDPWVVLRKIASTWTRSSAALKQMRAETDALRSEVAALKRERGVLRRRRKVPNDDPST